jgi:hypothetical protein
MRPALILALISAFTGILAGLYAPRATEATVYSFTLRVHPGAGFNLNCGWHDGPCPGSPSTGHALDWESQAYYQINWKSFGWRNFSGSGVIARGEIDEVKEQCWKVKVIVRSTIPYNVEQGKISYTHSETDWDGTVFDIKGGSSYTVTTRMVGYTRYQDDPNCPGWVGGYWPAHLHQVDSGSPWTRNSAKYPTCTVCMPNWPGCENPHPIWTIGYHQFSRNWSYTN